MTRQHYFSERFPFPAGMLGLLGSNLSPGLTRQNNLCVEIGFNLGARA